MADAEYTVEGKHILVTGGAGFIGSRLVGELLHRGAEVTVLEDDESRICRLHDLLNNPATHARIHLVCCPMNAALEAQRERWGNIDSVVYLRLALSRSASLYDQNIDDLAMNIVPVLNLIKILKDSIKGFCFASSVSVYGCPDHTPLAETDLLKPETGYAATKLAIESYLRSYQEKSRVPVTVLRLATVYGPGERKYRAIPSFLHALTNGLPPLINGDGSEIRDYVYIGDVVEAIIQASLRRPANTLNIGSGRGFSTLQIAQKLIRLCSPGIEPVFKPRIQKNTDIICDISLAGKMLGYLPGTDIDQGLSMEAEWYRKNAVAGINEQNCG